MVASCPSTPPVFRRPPSRTLGALFAGSAVMFSAAALHDGALLTTTDGVSPVAEPLAEGSTVGASTAPAGFGAASAAAMQSPAPALAPGEAAPWAPGATPDWGASLAQLPIRRAPVRTAPQVTTNPVVTTVNVTTNNERDDFGSSSADQPDSPVLEDMLGYFVKGFGV